MGWNKNYSIKLSKGGINMKIKRIIYLLWLFVSVISMIFIALFCFNWETVLFILFFFFAMSSMVGTFVFIFECITGFKTLFKKDKDDEL